MLKSNYERIFNWITISYVGKAKAIGYKSQTFDVMYKRLGHIKAEKLGYSVVIVKSNILLLFSVKFVTKQNNIT